MRIGALFIAIGCYWSLSVSAAPRVENPHRDPRYQPVRAATPAADAIPCTDGKLSDSWSARQGDGSSLFVTPGWPELNLEVTKNGSAVEIDSDTLRATLAIEGTAAVRDISSHLMVHDGRIRVRSTSTSTLHLSSGRPVALAIVAQPKSDSAKSVSCNARLYPTASIAPAQIRLRSESGHSPSLPTGAFIRFRNIDTGHHFDTDGTGYYSRLPQGTYRVQLMDPTRSMSGVGLFALDQRLLILPVRSESTRDHPNPLVVSGVE